MGHLAICRTCQLAFAFTVVAEGYSVGLPGFAYCPRCGGEASLSDGTLPGIFRLINDAFPSATPPKIKRQVLSIASRIATSDAPAAQTLAISAHAEDDPENARFLWMMGASIAAIIIAVLTYLQTQEALESDEDYQRTNQATSEQMLVELRRIADAQADTASPEPRTRSRARIPPAAQAESGDAPKPKPRSAGRKKK